MAIVGHLEVPEELLELFRKLVSVTDARRRGAVRKHGYLQSRKRIEGLTSQSLLPRISALRAQLTPSQIEAWKAAADENGTSWWNLFVQDTSYRMKFGIEGLAVPSTLHQYKVGRIEIAAPAERVQLVQYHPEKYYVSRKIRGNTTQREDVAIHERLLLPLRIGMSYRADLQPNRPTPTARFYAKIFSSYQGRTIETELEIPFELQSGWQRAEAEISEVQGIARSYELHIEIDGARGWFEWDNVLAHHTGTNYARDWRCTDVNNELTTANFQIESSWEELFLPRGTAFDSVYPDDSDAVVLFEGYGTAELGVTQFGQRVQTFDTVGLGRYEYGNATYGSRVL